MTDIEIAEKAKLENIVDIAHKLGLNNEQIICYGNNMAKINKSTIPRKDNKLVLVSSMSPTPSGNGKTTISIGLADALSRLGKSTSLALREPSLGPVFGLKGGATGGGYSQVVPMAEINLHFTGDFHAITSANNLLCSAIDNSIYFDNPLGIDPSRIVFHRCEDINDRALRNCSTNDGKTENKTSFQITAASEIMAVLSLAKDLSDLKRRLGNIIVAYTFESLPVFAKDLKVVDAMTILLKNALLPNLVQTLEGTPAIIHAGPFANIAHGCNSVIATNLSCGLSEYTITEAGFGADLGAEKFLDIKCKSATLNPNAVVIVATIPALEYHGQNSQTQLVSGFENLKHHINTITQQFGLPVVVAINRFPTDTDEKLKELGSLLEKINTPYAVCECYKKGGEGAIELAKQVINLCQTTPKLKNIYEKTDSIEEKLHKIVTKVYGGKGVKLTPSALEDIRKINTLGLSHLPIVIAKTQYSLSDDPKLIGTPKDFEITISSLEPKGGSEFIVAIAGKTLLMPGLPRVPAYENMSISDNGIIRGLF